MANGGGGDSILRPQPATARPPGWRTPAEAGSSRPAEMRAQAVIRCWLQYSSRVSSPVEIVDPLVPRNNGGLDIAAAVEHVTQHVVQTRQRRLARNVVGAAHLPLGNQAERPANGFGRVVEGRFQRNLGVVQAIGIQLDLG